MDEIIKIEEEHVGKYLTIRYLGDEFGIKTDFVNGSELPLHERYMYGIISHEEFMEELHKNSLNSVKDLLETLKQQYDSIDGAKEIINSFKFE